MVWFLSRRKDRLYPPCLLFTLAISSYIFFYFQLMHNVKSDPIDTGRKLNVLCTFTLRPVSTGNFIYIIHMRSMAACICSVLAVRLLYQVAQIAYWTSHEHIMNKFWLNGVSNQMARGSWLKFSQITSSWRVFGALFYFFNKRLL